MKHHEKRAMRLVLALSLVLTLLVGVSASASASPLMVKPGIPISPNEYPLPDSTQAEIIYNWVTEPWAVTGLVANGQPQTLIHAGTVREGGTAYYYMTTERISGPEARDRWFSSGNYKPGRFSAELPTATEAGTYYVWYAIDGGPNYSDLDPYEIMNEGTENEAAVEYMLTVTIAEPPHVHSDAYGNAISFQPWTETDSLPTSGSWYLTADVALGGTWSVNNSVDLCLNGHTVSANGFNAVHVNDTGVLNLYGENGGAINSVDLYSSNAVVVSGALNLYGGALHGTVEMFDPGAVFNMFGGSVYDGSVWIMEGAFHLSGGSIVNNGQSAVIVNDRFSMSGGTISGSNTGVEARDSGAVSISGGSITGNSVGVLAFQTEIAISGSPNISGNSQQDAFLLDSMLRVAGRLDEAARIGVWMPLPGVFTTGLPGNGSAENFICGNGEGYIVSLSADGEAQIENHHEHSFSYGGGGKGVYDVIIASCSAANCPLDYSQVSIDLDPPADPVYDGNPKAPTVNGLEAFKEATGLPDSAFSYTYQKRPAAINDPELDGLPTDAGEYEVWLAVDYGGSSPIRASVIFTIAPPPHEHDGITFEPWESTTSLPTSGNYYLTNDVSVNGNRRVNGTLNLCLNGHTISCNGSEGYTRELFVITDGNTLHIYDENTGDAIGCVQNNIAGAAISVNGGTAYLHNALVRVNGNTYGVVEVTDGAFYMDGGKITSDVASCCVDLRSDAAFTMNGGFIGDSDGSGVNVCAGTTFTMNGGTIANNKYEGVQIQSGMQSGDPYEPDEPGGVFTMNGGAITGNNRSNWNGRGGVAVQAGEGEPEGIFNVSGSATVTDNTGGNVLLFENAAIHVTGALDPSALLGVTKYAQDPNSWQMIPATGAITSGLNGRGSESNFSIDNSSYTLFLNPSGELELVDPSLHYHNGITFEPWNETTSLPTASGSYCLTGDVTINNTWQVPSGGFNLCLNGYGIKMTGSGSVINVPSGSALNLYDCGSTVHYFTAPASGYGRATDIGNTNQGGQLSFTGGYITGGNFTSNNTAQGGGVNVKAGGFFTMNGGTIIGNRTAGQGRGAGVYAQGGQSDTVYFTMNGGAIMYNSADGSSGWGGAANIGGTAVITGGVISNNYAAQNKGGLHAHYLIISGGSIVNNYAAGAQSAAGAHADRGVTISGSPVISGNRVLGRNREYNLDWNIYYNQGYDYKLVIDGALGSAARIGVTMARPGLFTSGLPGRGDASNFTSDNENYNVYIKADGEAWLSLPLFTLSYNDNGAEGGALPTNDIYTYEEGTYVAVLGNTGGLVKEGYAFTGWNTAADGSGTAYAPGDSFWISENTTLYAQWEQAWPVTLHLNGGTVVSGDLSYYVQGVGATLPTDVARENYNFDGWYDNEAMLGSPVTKIGANATGAREFWLKWFYRDYHVYVASPDGVTTMYTGMEPSERIEVLKDMIAERTGIPAARIELTFGGRVLNNSGRFADYNIQKGSLLNVSFIPETLSGFELYYTLNSDTDADTDRFRDYRAGETVAATIYLRASRDTVLQAFDVYMSHSDGLDLTEVYSEYGEVVTDGDRPTDSTHIRLMAVGKEQGRKIEVPIAAGESYAIARIFFQFADFVNYDDGQPIALSDLSCIAIADTPENFEPGIGEDIRGAELRGTYLISFDDNTENEDIPVPAPFVARQRLPENLPDTVPVRTGYVFRGWTPDPETEGPVYEPGTEYRGTQDVTLYAVWEAERYPVTFYDDDGVTIIQNGEYPFGTRTDSIKPANPVKQGDARYSYRFIGWEPKLSELVNAPTSYVAVYEQIENEYNIVFQNWDGSMLQADKLKYGEIPVYRGSDPTHPSTESEIYHFLGWSPAIEPVTGNITYYAQFDPEVVLYTVSFNNNSHGDRTPGSQHIGYGGHANDSGELYETGWIFEGWYKDPDGQERWQFDTETVTGDTTIYAKWKERQYNMVYVPNGGSGDIPRGGYVPYTQSFTLPDGVGLVRTGYHFTGWNTRADGSGDSFSPGAPVTVKDNLINYVNNEAVYLYAMWTADDYVITYELGGGQWQSGQENPVSYNADGLPLTLEYTPVRAGYEFNGWYAVYTDSGETVSLIDGHIIREGTTGNLTVTANWSPARVTYKVEHYRQYVDGDGYSLYITDVAEGRTGEQTAAVSNDYSGFTAQPFAQKTVEADGSTVVQIYYDRNYYTVSYFYSGEKTDGAPSVPTTVRYKYGKTVVVENVPSLAGYDFDGWKTEDVLVVSGHFTMPDHDVSFDGRWIALAVPYTVEHWLQNVNDDGYTLEETDTTLTGKVGELTQAAPNSYSGFTVVPYEQQPVNSDGSSVVRIYYNRVTHTVRYAIDGAPENMSIPRPTEYRVGAYVTLAELEVPNGYTLGELTTDPAQQIDNERRFVMPDGDVTINGTCTPISYTVTFDVTVGDQPIDSMTYTIESTETLPAADSALYRFEGWKVTVEDGNWALNAVYNADTALTGKYGNVTLTAQWAEKVSYLVDEYKYAPQGWYMLRIKDDLGAHQSYAFGGEEMFVIGDPNYRIDDEVYTFYTLIPGEYVEGSKLNEVGYSRISSLEVEQRSRVDYNGDVNNDGMITVADANAVFQMLAQSSYGGYYGIDQLSIRDRLSADMVKAVQNADHRGSIEDVNAIVNLVVGR